MSTARLRSTRRAWPCSGQDLSHSPQNGSALVRMAGVDDRPLILNRSSEHQTPAQRAGREATGPRGAGVTVTLTLRDARQLQSSLERQLKAIRSSLAFWKHETTNFGTQPPFNMAAKLKEAELIQRLYLELFDITKAMHQYETAYKAAKYQE